jgi:hypothetical protein
MAKPVHRSPARHPLPADRAFVVQLSAASDLAQRRLSGRIEHVVSGTSAHFRSLEQLLGFIRRLVRDAT